MSLINCKAYHVDYLSAFNAVDITFRGTVKTDQVMKLRNMLESLGESLCLKKLILNFNECNQVFIDYNSPARIAFWKSLEHHGLNMILLIFPLNCFHKKARESWVSFFKKNHLDIQVLAISDRKLMPLFLLKDTLASREKILHENN